MRKIFLLLLLIPSFCFAATLRSNVDPSAIACLEGFVQKYETSHYYSTRIKKTESDFGSRPYIEHLELREWNKSKIELKFVDPGLSGIRNNGMTATYTTGDDVEIKLGSSHGLGVLLNGLAHVFANKRIKLFSLDAISHQILTVNRAGFGYLASVIEKDLPRLKKGELGRLSREGPSCLIHFTHDPTLDEVINVLPDQSVQELEEKYGTLAYFIFRGNSDKFSSFQSLFQRSRKMSLKISPAFADFVIELDARQLPTHIDIDWNGKTIGHYEFTETVIR